MVIKKSGLCRYIGTTLTTYIETSASMKWFDNCRIGKINFTAVDIGTGTIPFGILYGSASRGVAHETSTRGVQAMAAHDPAAAEVAKGPGVPYAGDSDIAKHCGTSAPASHKITS